MHSSTHREWLGLAALILAAGALRLAALADLPPALWYDEAINGLDAWGMIRDGRLPLFFDTGGHPREPLFIWMVALMQLVAGPTPVAIRGVSAIVGIVTVALFFWMMRVALRQPATIPSDHLDQSSSNSQSILSDPTVLPWLAAGALATLRWHVHFSRTSFRTILTPLAIILVVGLLIRAMHSRRMRDYALAGAALGLGFYTYLSFRLAPLIVAVVLFHPEYRRLWLRGGRGWRAIGVMCLAAFVALSPLLVNYANHPEHFSGRTDQVTLFADGLMAGMKQVGGNAISVLGMFSWPGRGDHVPKHNIPNEPVFPWPAAIFFYAGLIIAVARARRRGLDAVMLVWLFVLLQASIWSFGAPNLLRTVGATPAVVYFLAVGWLAAARGLGMLLESFCSAPARRAAMLGALGAMFLIYSVPQVSGYFHTWARDPRVPRDFNDTFFEVAAFAQMSAGEGAYVLMQDELHGHPTVEFLLLRSPEVVVLNDAGLDEMAAAWREGRAPFEKRAPLLLIFTPTGSELEREAVTAFRPAARQPVGFFPVYIVSERAGARVTP